MKKYSLVLIALFLMVGVNVNAQCKLNNDFFQAGEELSLDLYYKYGIINMKAGNTTLKTVSEKFKGADAYKMTLIANSSGAAKSIFTLSDTLSIYTTKELIPLQYKKKAHENGDFVDETIDYTYKSGIGIRTQRTKNGTKRFDENLTSNVCVYDMLSIVYYARTLDYSSMKKGDNSTVSFVSGSTKGSMQIRHKGTEVVKANDGKKYDCIILSLIINDGDDSKFEDKNESMRVFVTNDKNRMPVQLDIKLKVGKTRGILRSYKGNKHPVATK